MALTDVTDGSRIIKEGKNPVRLTLSAAVKAGDLIGDSSGTWVEADADAPVMPQFIAGVGGASGDVITAYKQALIGGVTCALGDLIYSSATAGDYTSTATGVSLPIGMAVSTTEMFIDLQHPVGGASLSIVCLVPNISMSTIADGDLVTTITPGFAGKIRSVYWVQDVPVTTAAKASTLNLEIGITDLTGGVVSLTSATCTPKGVVIAGTAITAGNVFKADSTISVEAASTTSFVEGSGSLYAVIETTL